MIKWNSHHNTVLNNTKYSWRISVGQQRKGYGIFTIAENADLEKEKHLTEVFLGYTSLILLQTNWRYSFESASDCRQVIHWWPMTFDVNNSFNQRCIMWFATSPLYRLTSVSRISSHWNSDLKMWTQQWSVGEHTIFMEVNGRGDVPSKAWSFDHNMTSPFTTIIINCSSTDTH